MTVCRLFAHQCNYASVIHIDRMVGCAYLLKLVVAFGDFSAVTKVALLRLVCFNRNRVDIHSRRVTQAGEILLD